MGYYDDGVKRTLTDAQIEIFRHSEIQALLRERRHAEEAASDGLVQQTADPTENQREYEEDRLRDDYMKESSPAVSSITSGQQLSRKGRKAEQAKQKGYFKQKIKPDLRKRTWDNVDSGMGSLDYGDESASASTMNPPPQRRRISYDD